MGENSLKPSFSIDKQSFACVDLTVDVHVFRSLDKQLRPMKD